MSVSIIDCHNHIYAEEFDQDREDAIEEAKKVGVVGMIAVSEFSSDVDKILFLATKYPKFMHFGLGIHPVQKTGDKERSATEEDLDAMRPLMEAHAEEMVCVGEVGLDFTPRYCQGSDDKEHQKHVFTQQIEIADRLNLPVNVHSRSAGRPVVKLLKENNVTRALLHAFDGRVSVAMEAIQAGYYLSLPPCVLRSEQKQKISQAIPLDRILLETDCPALGPEKMERNHPRNALLSLQYLAKSRKIDIDTLSRLIYENTLKLFPRIAAVINS